jgi:Protein of unknown function (DUF3304)
MMDPMKRSWLRFIGLGALAGCAVAQPKGRSVSTVSFNYTDRYIGDVIVNGAWTGGVDAYGGGGKMAEGLIAPADTNQRAVLKVRWSYGSIYDVATNTYARTAIEERSAEVEVSRPYPANPRYLVLHFYPDGRVEAELDAGPPRRRTPPPAGYHRQ